MHACRRKVATRITWAHAGVLTGARVAALKGPHSRGSHWPKLHAGTAEERLSSAQAVCAVHAQLARRTTRSCAAPHIYDQALKAPQETFTRHGSRQGTCMPVGLPSKKNFKCHEAMKLPEARQFPLGMGHARSRACQSARPSKMSKCHEACPEKSARPSKMSKCHEACPEKAFNSSPLPNFPARTGLRVHCRTPCVVSLAPSPLAPEWHARHVYKPAGWASGVERPWQGLY